MTMKGSKNTPQAPVGPRSVERRDNQKKERMDKLREVYQRVQGRDPDPEAALRDVQEAVLVILEEFTNSVYNGA